MAEQHERAFLKRLTHLRTALKATKPDLRWVEGVLEDGTVMFYLTEVLLTAAGGNGTRTLRLERPNCENCHQTWFQHAPPGGQCLFQSTTYDHV